MDQKTILSALQNALEHGTGSLDDLSNLLSRAQADVEKAKKEQEEADRIARENAEKAKLARGQQIAELATRLLEGQPSDEDVAMVLQTYLNSKGIEAEVSAKSIADSIQAQQELDKNLNELFGGLKELFEALGGNEKPACQTARRPAARPKTDDDTIDSFLRGLGLRE